ncbi:MULTISPECIES: GH25 family lysozyme [Corynebacterium]|uniref:GH25 family lysozyme n=1 Tax=Corynebacterium TaxID=1716 RepID=UPI0002F3FA59|nr:MULTISPECIES: GH25 family lysozyme [Corynebacterium]AST21418.1 glycosyl hydrolase [Corynebacterium glutamicum ATCC 14067]KEI23948.1 glycosyl hydrolase family 25 [Corynebacterium glutamicum ATCC 14067]QJS16560.1 peptidoglycan DD-metalloendopeptidase family protein [Corynebacterium glutamicum]QXU45086.1 peptidoglycan DD-metalloendopeptidase family protein [[Brevibacterium] flavum]
MAKRYRPVVAESYVTSGFGARWGTQHRGTDFGLSGGSANMPVYAAQGGTVVYAGAASGFGGPDPAGWVVIDHPTADGSGTTVYGHIIREVALGERVEAGQRIGRVNPNKATNGNVAPHLHFEVHKSTWLPGAQIDPVPWLGDAASPDTSQMSAKPETMQDGVLFGVDISNHQNGIPLKRVASEGFKFVIIKATEGTWKDPILHSHLADARTTDMQVAAYVYVRSTASAKAHADTLASHLSDTSVPIALDIEDGAGADPNFWRAVRDEIEARGYRVILTYLPKWYWDQVGQPSLAGLPPLWTSRYPDMIRGYASEIYTRAGSKGWEGYGGLDVRIWQFTSTANVAGYGIDANAFRGSEAELVKLFTGKSNTKTFLEVLMSDTVKSFINPGKTFPAPTALSLIDASNWRSEVLTEALLQALGFDTEKILAAAIEADNSGADRSLAIGQALNLKEKK